MKAPMKEVITGVALLARRETKMGDQQNANVLPGDTLIMTGHGALNPRTDSVDSLLDVVAGIRDEYLALRRDALDQMELWAAQGDAGETSRSSTEAERHGAALQASSRILRLLEDFFGAQNKEPRP